MNATDLKGRSKTNLEALDRKTDAEIDTSEIPPLGDKFFAQAAWESPEQPIVILTVDAEVLEWFKSQGGDFRWRLNVALRIYAEAHKAV